MLFDPLSWKIKAVIVLGVIALSAIAGGVVGSWRAKANANGTIEQLHKDVADRDARILQAKDELHKMELAVSDANKALAVAEAQTQAAEQMQRQAKAYADEQSKISGSRLDKLAAMAEKASGCGEVLRKYWEMRE